MGVSTPLPHGLGDAGNPADPDTDSGAEPAPERLGQLLSLWVSERRLRDQPLRTPPSPAEPEETQPAALPFAQQVSIMPDEEMKRDFQLLSTKISVVVKDGHY